MIKISEDAGQDKSRVSKFQKGIIELRISESKIRSLIFVCLLYSEMNGRHNTAVGFRMRTGGHEFLRHQRQE